jgi:polygalacturonase
MPESINFSTLAKRALAEGLTTAELGRQIGLSQPAVSRLATGKTKSVAADVAIRLINVVGGSVGNDTTDDTTAIQNALSAGAGKTVYVPPGTYKITDYLTVSANTLVTGPGTIHQTSTRSRRERRNA